jgi:hypothetical protein
MPQTVAGGIWRYGGPVVIGQSQCEVRTPVTVISSGKIVTPDGVLAAGWLQTDGRTIARLGTGQPPQPPDRELDGAWVVPGFVDIHVHGGGRASYVAGDQDQAIAAAALHRRHGTTTTMASWRIWSTTACWPVSISRGRSCPRSVAERTIRRC